VWYSLKTRLPPSQRAAVVPPGLSDEAAAAVVKRRLFVQKLATTRYRKVGCAPQHWVWVGKKYPTSRAIKIALAERYDIDVSVWTVRRDLLSIGMVAKHRSRAPRHRDGDEQRRLTYCIAERNVDVKTRLFCDECYVDDEEHGNRTEWCWPDEHPSPMTSIQYATKLHVFALIGIGVKRLIILDCNRVNSANYIKECLMPNLAVLSRPGVALCQDGAKAHTAKKTLQWMTAHGVKVVLGWPARSPDLNPTEEVWALLRDLVSSRHPTSKEELRKAVLEAWEEIPQSVIDMFVERYNRKVEACIDARGGHFKVPRSKKVM